MHLERLNARRRETVPASEPVVGVQCGGSDGSGVTANPRSADERPLVRAGATVMFSETTEVRDAIDQLTARAATPEVAEAMVREMAWYDAYLRAAASTAAPTPRRATEGRACPNIVEKAMARSSERQRADRRRAGAGRKLRARDQRGLIYAATPASDFICGTLQPPPA